ncbi:MAG: sulfatase-like hydrolase/transferase [Spirochaetales bacterium]|nr:sulfatase-like hydrolase/transferase [Spirochaetales bacterium]
MTRKSVTGGDLQARHSLSFLFFVLANSILFYAYYDSNANGMIRMVKKTMIQTDRAFFMLYAFLLASGLAFVLLLLYSALRRRIAETSLFKMAALLYVLVWFILIVDTGAFLRTGMHLLDSYVLRSLSSPDFYRNIRLPVDQWLLIAGLPVLVFLIQSSLIFASNRAARFFRLPSRIHFWLLIGFALFGLATARAYYVLHKDKFLTVGNPVLKALPGYELFFSGWGQARLQLSVPLPQHPPLSQKKRKSILMIVADSVQYKSVHPETMPFLHRFRQSRPGIESQYHYSTAHYTEPGIFSLVCGLDGFHYQPFASREARVFALKQLQESGFRLHAYASTQIRSWHAAEFFFDQFDDYREFVRHGRFDKDDAALTRALVDFAGQKKDGPFFMLAVLNSSHHNYPYPPEFEHFKPAAPENFDIDRIRERDEWELLRNRYYNSLRYVDSLLETILGAFAAQIASGELIVVFTSDHGEEFNERGLWGHIKINPYNEQMRVPLYFYIPGVSSPRHRLTSSSDIMPTIFDAMGLSGESLPFNGRSLLSPLPQDHLVTVMGLGFPLWGNLITAIDSRTKIRFYRDDDFRVFTAGLITDLDDEPLSLSPEEIALRERFLRERVLRFLQPY